MVPATFQENINPDNTRIGIAAFIEDAFHAALERQAAFERFEALSEEEQMEQRAANEKIKRITA